MFAAVARGYLDGCGSMLTAVERTSLVFGARMVTGMLALRFLTDYLDGDRYFRIERPLHNLERARNQLALLRRTWSRRRRSAVSPALIEYMRQRSPPVRILRASDA